MSVLVAIHRPGVERLHEIGLTEDRFIRSDSEHDIS